MEELHTPPSLRTLELLIIVVEKLVEENGDLTRTWLKRYVFLNDDRTTDATLKHGIDKKLLVQKRQGYIGLAKGVGVSDAVIGEESATTRRSRSNSRHFGSPTTTAPLNSLSRIPLAEMRKSSARGPAPISLWSLTRNFRSPSDTNLTS
ncbi:hypothetical protein [Pararhizobium sp. PWRC1-1]|uniref:hypothetical protein n=1 Tax=Pararhizobium sp. PWRC1-1 TaxID=2804566 RepID=UPI003CF25A34